MGLFQSAIIIILTFVLAVPTFAQSEIVSIGARQQAMGNAAVALEDNFAPFNNVAACAAITQITAISSFEHKYGFTPFQHLGAGAILPKNQGVFSLTLQRFGTQLYNEQHIGLGFSHKSGAISLGVKINYSQFRIEDTGTKGAVVFELGGLAKILPNLSFGAHVYNLSQSALSKDENLYLPFILKSGFSYQATKALILCLEVKKEIDHSFNIQGGLEYQFLQKFHLRSGVSSAPFQQYYGLGFSPAGFSIDYALQNHNRLGISHQLSLAYQFRK